MNALTSLLEKIPFRKLCRLSALVSTIIVGSPASGVLNRFGLCERSRVVNPVLAVTLSPPTCRVYGSEASAASRLFKIVVACALVRSLCAKRSVERSSKLVNALRAVSVNPVPNASGLPSKSMNETAVCAPSFPNTVAICASLRLVFWRVKLSAPARSSMFAIAASR